MGEEPKLPRAGGGIEQQFLDFIAEWVIKPWRDEISNIRVELTGLRKDMEDRFASQTRTLYWVAVIMLTVVGLFIALMHGAAK